MADMHELEIKIDADGNVTVRVQGKEGPACVELTKELEEALGIVTERKLTEEYYEEELTAEEHVDRKDG